MKSQCFLWKILMKTTFILLPKPSAETLTFQSSMISISPTQESTLENASLGSTGAQPFHKMIQGKAVEQTWLWFLHEQPFHNMTPAISTNCLSCSNAVLQLAKCPLLRPRSQPQYIQKPGLYRFICFLSLNNRLTCINRIELLQKHIHYFLLPLYYT